MRKPGSSESGIQIPHHHGYQIPRLAPPFQNTQHLGVWELRSTHQYIHGRGETYCDARMVFPQLL
ncbi:hypothetical protein DPMN_015054 [Dreissena polymorpha]|uniref:Uncharacterized protein n=1 Tax=Dreissena polymorpha TaxID=45954 RepID=A0A9D4NAI2_DREPO|nr:hypothetical protein DPMN_015054 [Dreissena polymorpha]